MPRKVSWQQALSLVVLSVFLWPTACQDRHREIPSRPIDPWFFRSVLDRKPRMLTLALDTACYVAYDLANCTLYKAWKGGVSLEGTVYTDKKNVQPLAWGTPYFSDSLRAFAWVAKSNGVKDEARVVSKGYILKNGQLSLQFAMILSSGDSIHIEEVPEFARSRSGNPGLERTFTTSKVPRGITVSIESEDSTFTLGVNETASNVAYFKALPRQFPRNPEEAYDHRGRYWMEKSDCFTCHELDQTTVGPSFRQIAVRYREGNTAKELLVRKVIDGGTGVWGQSVMNAHPGLTESEVKVMLDYILSLRSGDDEEPPSAAQGEKPVENARPGFGAALEGVHPSYDLATIHGTDFKPRVGGLAFLPDGRLLVATWDYIGGVYLMDGVETGDTTKINVKRIASGLAEPLGIEVVDGAIFVLQKQELTQLIDLDGDEVIDEYRAICNSWGVSADFHEFAFGLVFRDGYFYATLSMAMRLMSYERQHPDRGRTIRISKDGRYEWVNYGLRTPNGIGLGMDNELFLTDNQGEWLPANKLIHIREGEYHGMPWALPDSVPTPPTTPPAIWLPEDEIGNSPSEPVLVPDGPYQGQLLHGDVTHGGIKRDFLEKVGGAYQGAVFRFTQGLEAGVNRLSWGPDGALYVGGVGMVGGWSWKEKKYGLQRLKYNGRVAFEMLAVRAKPGGFEIEFTDALGADSFRAADIRIQQWWYLATAGYGGPKMGLENLRVARVEVSQDRKRVFLGIPGLKKERVVYFRLAEDLKSESRQPLWSSEAWYTLNRLPGE